MIDRRYFRYFDLISFILTMMLLGLGLLFVFSSTYSPERPFSVFFDATQHVISMGVG